MVAPARLEHPVVAGVEDGPGFETREPACAQQAGFGVVGVAVVVVVEVGREGLVEGCFVDFYAQFVGELEEEGLGLWVWGVRVGEG